MTTRKPKNSGGVVRKKHRHKYDNWIQDIMPLQKKVFVCKCGKEKAMKNQVRKKRKSFPTWKCPSCTTRNSTLNKRCMNCGVPQ